MRNRLHSSESVGRGIARFLEDLRWSQALDAAPELCAQIVPVVLQCNACGKFHHVSVRFVDDDPIVLKLPDNCRCGEMLDTPAVIADVIGTARHLIEAAHTLRLA